MCVCVHSAQFMARMNAFCSLKMAWIDIGCEHKIEEKIRKERAKAEANESNVEQRLQKGKGKIRRRKLKNKCFGFCGYVRFCAVSFESRFHTFLFAFFVWVSKFLYLTFAEYTVRTPLKQMQPSFTFVSHRETLIFVIWFQFWHLKEQPHSP